MTDATPRRPAVPQVLLGLFICWQVIYLAVTTLDTALTGGKAPFSWPRSPESDAAAAQERANPLRWLPLAAWQWSKLTLQLQYWRVFPDFPPRSVFVAVRLNWDDDVHPPVVLLSRFEPADPYRHAFVEWQAVRLYHFEANLNLAAPPERFPAHAEHREYWLRNYYRPLLGYLRWRLREWQREHPDAPPPSEVVFLHRVYLTPLPGQAPWTYEGPLERPYARWRPQAETPAGQAPLELFDLRTGKFVPVAIEP